MRRICAILGLLAVVLAWWTLRKDDPTPRAPPQVTETAPEAPLAPPGPRPAPAPAPEVEVRAVRVRGRVRRPDGVGWQGALYAVGEVEGERRRLGIQVVHDGDEFTAEIPFEGASSPWPIEFGVSGSGFARVSRQIEAEPGGEYRVDLDLGSGGVLEGIVLDPEGRAVPDLEMLVLPGAGPESLVSQWSVDVGRLLLNTANTFALCRTDGAGHFSVAGLAPGSYSLVSRDQAWALEHEDGLAPDRRDVRITAQPAFSLFGEAVDQFTGEPVPVVRVEMVMCAGEDRTTLAGTCAGERLLMVWNPSQRFRNGCTAHVTVAAEGYEDLRIELSFGPDTRSNRLRAALNPVEPPPLGAIIVEPVTTTGRRVDFPLLFMLASAEDPDRRPDLVEQEPLGDGRYRIRGPVGRWVLRTMPADGMLGHLTTPVEIREGVEERIRLQLPPHGVVRFRLSGFEEGADVSIHAADGSWGFSTSGGRDGMVFVAAPGRLSAEVAGAAEPARQEVDLVDGQDVVLTFVR